MKKKLSLVLALLFLTACSASPSGTSPEGTTSNTGATETPSSSAPVETPTPSEEPPVETAFAIGDTATLGMWEINVTGFEFTEKVEAQYGHFSPEDGNQYGVVSMSVTNTGKEADYFLPSFGLNSDVSARILYGDGYEYSATNLLGHDEDLHNKSLNPLTSASGIIAFELPQAVVDSTEPLVLAFSAGGEQITYTLR